MSLENPLFLLLLILAAAAAWLYFRSSGPQEAAWPLPENSSLSEARPSLKARAAALHSPVLILSALALIVLALARPEKILERLHGSGEGIDIMLAMDTSTSMSAIDLSPSRIQAAKAAAISFIARRTSDLIGAIQFGGAPELVCPLTSDYSALDSQISALYPGMTGSDGTAIGDGIVSALNHLKAGTAKSKIIILMTDGRSNTGLVDPITAAKVAQEQGVKIYTIGCAKHGPAEAPVQTPEGTVMATVSDDLDDALLTKIADMTGGRYYRVSDSQNLRQIYDIIDKLEKSKTRQPPELIKSDLYQYPAAAAAICLVLEAILGGVFFLRWP